MRTTAHFAGAHVSFIFEHDWGKTTTITEKQFCFRSNCIFGIDYVNPGSEDYDSSDVICSKISMATFPHLIYWRKDLSITLHVQWFTEAQPLNILKFCDRRKNKGDQFLLKYLITLMQIQKKFFQTKMLGAIILKLPGYEKTGWLIGKIKKKTK